VADRENGRIEKFDLDGNFLGEIPHLGRVYSLKLVGGVLWSGYATLQPATGLGWLGGQVRLRDGQNIRAPRRSGGARIAFHRADGIRGTTHDFGHRVAVVQGELMLLAYAIRLSS
jgi:hypothetical protein